MIEWLVYLFRLLPFAGLLSSAFAFHQSTRQRFASASNIQLFVPLLFHHSLIKLYPEGALTSVG